MGYPCPGLQRARPRAGRRCKSTKNASGYKLGVCAWATPVRVCKELGQELEVDVNQYKKKSFRLQAWGFRLGYPCPGLQIAWPRAGGRCKSIKKFVLAGWLEVYDWITLFRVCKKLGQELDVNVNQQKMLPATSLEIALGLPLSGSANSSGYYHCLLGSLGSGLFEPNPGQEPFTIQR